MVVDINHTIPTQKIKFDMIPASNSQFVASPTMATGYYSVNNNIYINKFEALMASKQNGGQVIWHWHTEYDQINWQVDSPLSVKEVYKLRAQQLRDKYDYLILCFSGGADSSTVLNTFITNNILLDEVYVRWPLSATQNQYNPNTKDINPSNMLSEWDFAIKPQLEILQKNYPNIRITLVDSSQKVLDTKFSDNLILQSSSCVPIGWWAALSGMSQQEIKILDGNGSVGTIFALDKPQIAIQNNKVYCYFLDSLMAETLPPNAPSRNIEFFYWTKNMPEVTYVQARAIYNHIKLYPQYKSFCQFGGVFDSTKKYHWDRYIKTIIYPDWDINTFQVKKNENSVYNDTYLWARQMIDRNSYQAWESMINNLFSSLSDQHTKYIHGRPSGFAGFISKMYYLGDLPVIL